jgi:hypothetical protein
MLEEVLYLDGVEIQNSLSISLKREICKHLETSMPGAVSSKQNEEILVTRCFLYHETLGAKTTKEPLKLVLEKAVQVVNFINGRPLKSHIFVHICEWK